MEMKGFCEPGTPTASHFSDDGFRIRSSPDTLPKNLFFSPPENRLKCSIDREIPATTIMCDLLLWKKPLHSVIVLLLTTVIYMYCVALNQSLISLISNLLLYIITTFCVITNLSDYLRMNIISNPLPSEISPEFATCLVASFANLIGAAESVLRVAAFGSDFRLFAKVISFLFFTSVLGKILSAKTIVYLGVWILFTVPVTLSKILPEETFPAPKLCRRKSPKKNRRSNSFVHHTIEKPEFPSFRSQG